MDLQHLRDQIISVEGKITDHFRGSEGDKAQLILLHEILAETQKQTAILEGIQNNTFVTCQALEKLANPLVTIGYNAPAEPEKAAPEVLSPAPLLETPPQPSQESLPIAPQHLD